MQDWRSAFLWAPRCPPRLGHARDYVDAESMLQQNKPEDFVASGRRESVRRFIELAIALGWGEMQWDGEGRKKLGAAVTRGQ